MMDSSMAAKIMYPNADAEELKVKALTLIKVENGSIVEYYELTPEMATTAMGALQQAGAKPETMLNFGALMRDDMTRARDAALKNKILEARLAEFPLKAELMQARINKAQAGGGGGGRKAKAVPETSFIPDDKGGGWSK